MGVTPCSKKTSAANKKKLDRHGIEGGHKFENKTIHLNECETHV